jgi:UTP:GlnB (protein PII) uridylyltransferase
MLRAALRDIQTIAWVAKRHFDATNLYDLLVTAS